MREVMALVAAVILATLMLRPVAQATAPILVNAQVFRKGESLTGIPFREFSWLWEPQIYCNLEPKPKPIGVVYNPSFIEFVDPALPERACRLNWGPYLQTLPVATGYRLTITYLYADGPPSARSTVSGQFRRGALGTFCVDRGGAEIVDSTKRGEETIRISACAEAQ